MTNRTVPVSRPNADYAIVEPVVADRSRRLMIHEVIVGVICSLGIGTAGFVIALVVVGH